jgi:hypothetical protein
MRRKLAARPAGHDRCPKVGRFCLKALLRGTHIERVGHAHRLVEKYILVPIIGIIPDKAYSTVAGVGNEMANWKPWMSVGRRKVGQGHLL